MSRVNHKAVRELLSAKRSSITDREFFTSRILAGHYEDMAAAQSHRYRYNRRVRVRLYWDSKDDTIAYTDNAVITINTGSEFVTKTRGREKRYQITTGMFVHELGHVLYTDFLVMQTHRNFLESYRWYPNPPALKTSADMDNEREFWEYVKSSKENLEAVQMVTGDISNVLEDGYIENKILNNFPGSLGYALEKVRKVHFKAIPTVTQLKEEETEKGKPVFSSIMQAMLSYAKFGEIKYGDEPFSDIRIKTVFDLIGEIDGAVSYYSAKERYNVVNLVLIRCWKYIREFCELCKEMKEKSGNSETISQAIAEAIGKLVGGSVAASGTTAAVSESGCGSETSATAENRSKTHIDATAIGASSKEGTTEDEKITSELSSAEQPGKQKATNEEDGRIPFHETDAIDEPVGGGIEKNDAYKRINDDRAAADIERLLEQMAEKAVCADEENKRLRELNKVAQNISYGSAHAGVNVRVNRICDVDEELVEQYGEISAPLLQISRQLQRSILRQLEEKRNDVKQTGLLMGHRLDSHAIHRNDGKMFYKNALPNEQAELAVGLLLDESGSMSSCDRCTYARAAAIILYVFCHSLGIPIMIYGHSTGYINHSGEYERCVDLYSYAEFESIDKDDKYRLMDIAARGSNRDGAALRYVAEQLSKRSEDLKILILVSDGQPADIGYGGTAAEDDLRGIKREYQRKGILFVAAAIGDDKQNIERIYGDSFMDITDLNQLPSKLASVVKRHIRL